MINLKVYDQNHWVSSNIFSWFFNLYNLRRFQAPWIQKKWEKIAFKYGGILLESTYMCRICTYVRTRYMLPWDNFTQRQEVPSCEIAFITLTHFSCTKEGRKRGREKFHAHNSIWLCCLCQTRRNRRKKTGSGAHRFRSFRKFQKYCFKSRVCITDFL